MEPITQSGTAYSGALSPDGKKLVYSENARLFLKDLETGQTRQLTTEGQGGNTPSFSADGTTVYFVSFKLAGQPGKSEPASFVSMPLHEQERSSVRRAADVAGMYNAAVSPDGETVAFLKNEGRFNYSILLSPWEGSKQKVFTWNVGSYSCCSLAWSPDGGTIVTNSRDRHALLAVSLKSGEAKELASRSERIGAIAWAWGSNSLFAVVQSGAPGQIWRLDLSSRRWTPVTNDDMGFDGFSISTSADGTMLVAARGRVTMGFWDTMLNMFTRDYPKQLKFDLVLIRLQK